jgi:flagellar biosynthesis anti-sigma factor FlgM
MKIPSYINVNDAYLRHIRLPDKGKGTRGVSESRKQESDEIILSPRSAEVRQSEELIKDIPDVQQQKIEAVKKQIESNTYAVDGNLVARSIIDFLR